MAILVEFSNHSLMRRTICGITLAIKIEGFPVGND
jgi:hypothetical protein